MTPRAGALLSILALLVITSMTCGGCAHAIKASQAARTTEDERTLTVQISVRCENFPAGAEVWGSGAVISPTEILTAAHVVDCQIPDPKTGQPVGPSGKPTRILVSQPDHIGRPMRLIVSFVTNDLARLRIADDGEFYGFAPARIAGVKQGDVVCVSTGVPRRDVRCGLVEEKTTRQSGDVSISMPGYPGNSGSAVYDLKGRLVGVLTQRRNLAADAQISGALMTSLDGREWALDSFVLLSKVKP